MESSNEPAHDSELESAKLRALEGIKFEPRFMLDIWKGRSLHVANGIAKLFRTPDYENFKNFINSNKSEIGPDDEGIDDEKLITYYKCASTYRRLMYQRALTLLQIQNMYDIDAESCVDLLKSMPDVYPHYLLDTAYLWMGEHVVLRGTPYASICNDIPELIVDCLGYGNNTEGIMLQLEPAAQSLAMAIMQEDTVTVGILRNILQLYKASGCSRGFVRDVMRRCSQFVHLPVPSMCVKIAYLALINIATDVEYWDDGVETLTEVAAVICYYPCMQNVNPLISLPISAGQDVLNTLLYLVGNGKILKVKEFLRPNEKYARIIGTTRVNRLMKLIKNKEVVWPSITLVELMNSGDFPMDIERAVEVIAGYEDYVIIGKREVGASLIPFLLLPKELLLQTALKHKFEDNPKRKYNMYETIRKRAEYSDDDDQESFLIAAHLDGKSIYALPDPQMVNNNKALDREFKSHIAYLMYNRERNRRKIEKDKAQKLLEKAIEYKRAVSYAYVELASLMRVEMMAVAGVDPGDEEASAGFHTLPGVELLYQHTQLELVRYHLRTGAPLDLSNQAVSSNQQLHFSAQSPHQQQQQVLMPAAQLGPSCGQPRWVSMAPQFLEKYQQFARLIHQLKANNRRGAPSYIPYFEAPVESELTRIQIATCLHQMMAEMQPPQQQQQQSPPDDQPQRPVSPQASSSKT